jgi:hypothetical protein
MQNRIISSTICIKPRKKISQDNFITANCFNINSDARVVIFEHPPSQIKYKLAVPEGSRLSFGIGLDPKSWSPDKGDGVLFEIYVRNGGVQENVFSKYIDPKNNAEDRKWHDEVVDLSRFGGKEVSLTFVTSPGPNNNANYDWAGRRDPIIKTEGN